VVKGEAELPECIFMLPQKFRQLSQELSALLERAIPLNPQDYKEGKTGRIKKRKK